MRPMTAADVDAVLSIEQAVHAHPWTRGNFADALAAGYLCQVDEVGGELRGYAVLLPGVDEAELLTIGVAAAHQRRGLGEALLRAALRLADERGLSRIFLEVRPSNAAALALYRKAGFLEVGRRRSYYPAPHGREDAILMEGRS
ncbi:MAG: ribosomal protein S18-alanine N-acetyltransferase [Nitrosomonadales bacterium]|nr:ribosomal protein S18-alanine N-acetyltransferase [Nitrosomonadales bacterium]